MGIAQRLPQPLVPPDAHPQVIPDSSSLAEKSLTRSGGRSESVVAMIFVDIVEEVAGFPSA